MPAAPALPANRFACRLHTRGCLGASARALPGDRVCHGPVHGQRQKEQGAARLQDRSAEPFAKRVFSWSIYRLNTAEFGQSFEPHRISPIDSANPLTGRRRHAAGRKATGLYLRSMSGCLRLVQKPGGVFALREPCPQATHKSVYSPDRENENDRHGSAGNWNRRAFSVQLTLPITIFVRSTKARAERGLFARNGRTHGRPSAVHSLGQSPPGPWWQPLHWLDATNLPREAPAKS